MLMNQKLILWAAANPRDPASQMVLQMMEQMEHLQRQLNSYRVAAWVRVNDKGDLYDLRLHNNPYVDQDTVLPLYAKTEM